MDGDGEDFQLHWEEEVKPSIIHDTDQMAAENLMYLSQDVVSYTDAAELDPSVECVTEEVITDDWVIQGGQDRVEVPLEHLVNPDSVVHKQENDIDVPLPTDQDEYTAMRPWPCDFCSRRFRKKAALMNHMVAHQNDRPHACNLCGVRYVRKCDLMNHLKVHAYVPDNADSMDYEDVIENRVLLKPRKKRGRRKKNPAPVENGLWENMTSARTQQWSRRVRTPPRVATPTSPVSERSVTPASPPPQPPSPPPSPPPAPADPARPFVCRHCGVGFAREKALQSHARVHGGDSPVECGSCGELCWSREALAAHHRQRHPHQPHRQPTHEQDFDDTDSGDDDIDYRLSPSASTRGDSGDLVESVRGPALFCQDCGVAFQRADLLRRHVAAAHSYKRAMRDSTSSTWGEHTCDVCGETCPDALTLLAHAELHADDHRPPTHRFKKSRGRNNTSSSSSLRQFPCKECGKVFGSRSSQQIHVRIHTGERPYACRFCWKAFADGGTLRKHERIHTGEKPYACAVCPRAFNQRVVLREHVRSHHSAPDRRANGFPAYCCVVCSRVLHTSAELVQHLIQHCDANTAMKRQPQSGPRKYKRRRRVKAESSPAPEWESPAASPQPPMSPQPPASPAPAPSPPPPAPAPPRTSGRRGGRRPAAAPAAPPQRPRMIHTAEEPRTRNKQRRSVQVRPRRPPRRVADDLRAIGAAAARAAIVTTPVDIDADIDTKPVIVDTQHSTQPSDTGGPYRCEMCSLEFTRRDALLLHVPIHI